MEFLDESQLKNTISKNNTKQYTATSFYDIKTFKDVLKLAFRCKNQKTIDIILNNWYKLLDSEVKWGKLTKMISKKEEKLINSLHPQELLMIINIGKLLQTKHKIKPETAFIFAFGIVCAHFVFEETSMNLKIEEIYNTLPNKLKSKNKEKKFKKDFFIIGTSKEVRNILFKINKDER
tara:strand:+ start:41 stop:574 length:534 start_codon:yes stop_codon:yes gene_type:complete